MKRITYLFVLLAVSLGYSQNLLTNGDFESGDGTGWINNAVNVVDDGSGTNFINQAEVLAAGNPWDVNISQELALVDGETYTFSFDAYTATGTTRTMIVGIGNSAAPFGTNVVTETLTDALQTFTYTLDANYGTAALSRVIFDMGADSGFVFLDNVSLVLVGGAPPTCTDGIMNGDETGVDCGGTTCGPCAPATGLLVNGDFETGTAAPWGGNAANPVDDGSGTNFVNVADVAAAGNPWDVSLSQGDLSLVDGETYTFSFDAYTATGTTRDIIAGIGQDSGDFAANVVTTTLTDVVTTFSYDLVANYGLAGSMNSRVVFDMGADTGFVFIDNVTLVVAGPAAPTCTDGIQNGDETGVDCGGTTCGPCAAPVPVVLENFDGTAPTVTGDNGIVTSISSTQAVSAPNSLEVLTNGAGDPWQGAKLLMQDHKIDMTTADKTLTVDVYSDVPREYLVKLSNGDLEPTGLDPALESKTFVSHPGGGVWVTLIADFNLPADSGQPGYNPPNDQFSSVVFFPLYDSDADVDPTKGGWHPTSVTTSYIDNITGIAGDAIVPAGPTCTDGIMNGDETGEDCGGSCPNACADPDVLPTTAPPTPPARAAADVISIYGTAYGTAVGLNNVPWDDSDFVEETIAGNEVLRIDFGNFLGTDLGTVTDATAMTHFHIDYWVANSWAAGQVFNQKWSNHTGGAGETDAGDLTVALGPNDVQNWVSLDIPLTEAAGWFPAKGNGIAGREALTQFLITTAGLVNLGYVDNIYFHKNTTLSADKFDSLVFAAYPNPSSDKWQVQTKNENIETVNVYDLQGKQVLSLRPSTDNFTIDGSQLASGLYIAKIASRSKTQTLKLVKK